MKKIVILSLAIILLGSGCLSKKTTTPPLSDPNYPKEFKPINSIKDLPSGNPYVEPPTKPPEE